MELDALRAAAGQLLVRHDLATWKFVVSNRLQRTLGLCDYQHRVLTINEFYAHRNPHDMVTDTLLHEIAHALTPGHNHDAVWKALAVQLGCVPKACSMREALLPPGRFQAVCPMCKKTHHKHRLRYQAGYYCLACGTNDGALVFTEGGEK